MRLHVHWWHRSGPLGADVFEDDPREFRACRCGTVQVWIVPWLPMTDGLWRTLDVETAENLLIVLARKQADLPWGVVE